jgi:hypothetical protein
VEHFVHRRQRAKHLCPILIGSGRCHHRVQHAGPEQLLSKNYRTTTQISQAAYSLIRECPDIIEDENFVEPSLLDKQGVIPSTGRSATTRPRPLPVPRDKGTAGIPRPGRHGDHRTFRNQLDDIKIALEEGVKSHFHR